MQIAYIALRFRQPQCCRKAKRVFSLKQLELVNGDINCSAEPPYHATTGVHTQKNKTTNAAHNGHLSTTRQRPDYCLTTVGISNRPPIAALVLLHQTIGVMLRLNCTSNPTRFGLGEKVVGAAGWGGHFEAGAAVDKLRQLHFGWRAVWHRADRQS